MSLDKKILLGRIDDKEILYAEDVHEAVKELKDSFCGQINQKTEQAICKRINEIFGEKLI